MKKCHHNFCISSHFFFCLFSSEGSTKSMLSQSRRCSTHCACVCVPACHSKHVSSHIIIISYQYWYQVHMCLLHVCVCVCICMRGKTSPQTKGLLNFMCLFEVSSYMCHAIVNVNVCSEHRVYKYFPLHGAHFAVWHDSCTRDDADRKTILFLHSSHGVWTWIGRCHTY